ncbi:MAG TPA: radical SAM protein [Pirellulales bacterium]|nr:radical SAM protein [Pirellulales bacterium]
MLDLVLINPASRTQVYQSLGKRLASIENPVWAGLMAEFARWQGLSVEIIDAEALVLSAEQVAEEVASLNARLAVVVVYGHQPSASTQIMPAARRTCQAIKDLLPNQPILLAGGHVAALPQRTLEEEPADFVASGEGLWTIVDLASALKASPRPAGKRGQVRFAGTTRRALRTKRTRPLFPDLSRVRGLWYRQEDAVRSTPAAPLATDLDNQLPGIACDLLPMDRYRAHNWHCFGGHERQPYAAIYTTLGCPYHCSFCCIQAPFKAGEQAAGHKPGANSYRFWSPAHVIGLIDKLVIEHGVHNIKIADEMFVLNRRHVAAICDLIIERGYELNLWAYARVDTVHDALLDKLAQAGFRWLAFGIESASEQVRDGVDKRFDQQQIFTTLGKVRAAGIHVIGNYIFGLPDDDRDSMQATLDLALDLNCEFANFYTTMAYPGSPLYQQALALGWPLPEAWSGYSQHAVDTRPLPTAHLASDEVLAFRDAAFHTYFRGPRYRDMIRRTFGAETLEQVDDMSAHTLTRRSYAHV